MARASASQLYFEAEPIWLPLLGAMVACVGAISCFGFRFEPTPALTAAFIGATLCFLAQEFSHRARSPLAAPKLGRCAHRDRPRPAGLSVGYAIRRSRPAPQTVVPAPLLDDKRVLARARAATDKAGF